MVNSRKLKRNNFYSYIFISNGFLLNILITYKIFCTCKWEEEDWFFFCCLLFVCWRAENAIILFVCKDFSEKYPVENYLHIIYIYIKKNKTKTNPVKFSG